VRACGLSDRRGGRRTTFWYRSTRPPGDLPGAASASFGGLSGSGHTALDDFGCHLALASAPAAPARTREDGVLGGEGRVDGRALEELSTSQAEHGRGNGGGGGVGGSPAALFLSPLSLFTFLLPSRPRAKERDGRACHRRISRELGGSTSSAEASARAEKVLAAEDEAHSTHVAPGASRGTALTDYRYRRSPGARASRTRRHHHHHHHHHLLLLRHGHRHHHHHHHLLLLLLLLNQLRRHLSLAEPLPSRAHPTASTTTTAFADNVNAVVPVVVVVVVVVVVDVVQQGLRQRLLIALMPLGHPSQGPATSFTSSCSSFSFDIVAATAADTASTATVPLSWPSFLFSA
jgi:hypothetical protein